MTHKMLFIIIAVLFPTVVAAQNNIKILNVEMVESVQTADGIPSDLNGNKCAIVELNLANDAVAFEGNIVGAPTHNNGVYRVFLTPNSKYLNIKYPGENPILVKFSDYNIMNLPSLSIIVIEMVEPKSDMAAQLDSGMQEISDEADELYEKGGKFMMQNDYIRAFEYFIKAHDLGHPKAAYQLGFIYSDPYYAVRNNKLARNLVDVPDSPVERDLQKSFEYYLESAEAGYVTAQYAVGECLENGNGIKKNKDEAFKWYEKAASQGHLQAQAKLGESVQKNRMLGVVTSYGTSENEFILNSIDCDVSDLSAISNGRMDSNGQYCALVKVLMPFDNVTFRGNTIGEPVFKTNEYWVYVPQGTQDLSIEYPEFKSLNVNFKKAGIDKVIGKNTYSLHISFPIDLLKDDGTLTADDFYKIGMGYMERRDNQYIRWMSKASDANHPLAKYQLGSCYLYGNGVDKDVDKGIKLLESASEQGIAEASYYLGQYYELLGRNKKKAQYWYDKAAEQGHEASANKKAKSLVGRTLLGIF